MAYNPNDPFKKPKQTPFQDQSGVTTVAPPPPPPPAAPAFQPQQLGGLDLKGEMMAGLNTQAPAQAAPQATPVQAAQQAPVVNTPPPPPVTGNTPAPATPAVTQGAAPTTGLPPSTLNDLPEYIPDQGNRAPWLDDAGGVDIDLLMQYAQAGHPVAIAFLNDAQHRGSIWGDQIGDPTATGQVGQNWLNYMPGITQADLSRILGASPGEVAGDWEQRVEGYNRKFHPEMFAEGDAEGADGYTPGSKPPYIQGGAELPDPDAIWQQGADALAERTARSRETATRGIKERLASRGILGDANSPLYAQLGDLEGELALQEREGLSQMARERMGFALDARAQDLQKLFGDRDEAYRYAALEQDGRFRQMTLDLQRSGMDMDQAYRYAAMQWEKERFGRSMEMDDAHFQQTFGLQKQQLRAQIIEMATRNGMSEAQKNALLKSLGLE